MDFASHIRIQNFKSINRIEIKDCRRINLFIGRPNVGKSNILEALSLFSLPYYCITDYNYDPNLKNIIRLEQESELFHNANTKIESIVETDKNTVLINSNDRIIRIIDKGNKLHIPYTNSLDLDIKDTRSIFDFAGEINYRSYFFPKQFQFSKSSSFNFLLPFYGENLYDVVQINNHLREELITLLKEYNLNLVFDKGSKNIMLMSGLEKGEVFLIPFSMIADSLQRLIFFKTAIASNTNSIITFEEPEAHTYPPYISHIMQDVIVSDSNQFFITTHSPYVVNGLLEKKQDELAVFLIDLKNHETTVHRLSDNELNDVYNDGIDLFFNNEIFL